MSFLKILGSLFNGNDPIGQQMFFIKSNEDDIPTIFSYSAAIALNTGVLNINLSYYDLNNRIAKKLGQYFSEQDGKYVWSDSSAKFQFYNQILNDKNPPEELQKLKNDWMTITESYRRLF